jgi:hypothetical protein
MDWHKLEAMVATTSMVSDSIQPDLKLFALLWQLLKKHMKLTIMGSFNKILEFSFVGNKELKLVFVDCDWFDNTNGSQKN